MEQWQVSYTVLGPVTGSNGETLYKVVYANGVTGLLDVNGKPVGQVTDVSSGQSWGVTDPVEQKVVDNTIQYLDPGDQTYKASYQGIDYNQTVRTGAVVPLTVDGYQTGGIDPGDKTTNKISTTQNPTNPANSTAPTSPVTTPLPGVDSIGTFLNGELIPGVPNMWLVVGAIAALLLMGRGRD